MNETIAGKLAALSINDDLLGLDFLIYSSHKTATQTIVGSLNFNGMISRHCHNVGNINLKHSEFAVYLDQYASHNANPLNIISVFREPVERLISSFFQWYGTRQIKLGLVTTEDQTPIMKKPIPELQELFISEYCENLRVPTYESLYGICEQLSLHCDELKFSEKSAVGVNHLKMCNLYLLRFDLLVKNFSGLLSNIAGKNIELTNKNIGVSKFYADRYRMFKKTLKMPETTIERMYETRKPLFDIYYSGRYQEVLNETILQFGSQNVSYKVASIVPTE